MLGHKMMDVIIWARGKFLLLACDFGFVQSSLLSRLRIRSSQYTWAFFQSKSVVYCRLFLQPEFKAYLYVGSTAQTLSDRERTRWGKFKQIRAGKAVHGELSLFWYHRRANYHMAIPMVILHVPRADCLHTIEQTFINLLQPFLNAPWVRALVRAKHANIASSDPVRCVRRYVTSWRQFRRFRRRNLTLAGLAPSVFRSENVVQSIVYCYQILFDLASDSLQSFLAQKFLRSNQVDADMIYRLYRMATHLGDPFYETSCRSKLNQVLEFRSMRAPGVCRPLSIPFLLPERVFTRRARRLLGDILDVSTHKLLPYHVPSTSLVAKSHPKIKDILFSHKKILMQWDPKITPDQAGIRCCCAQILKDHPRLTVAQGHIASSATLLSLPDDLLCIAQSSCNNTVFMDAKAHWSCFRTTIYEWIEHHDLLRYDEKEVRAVWERLWREHEQALEGHWTVTQINRLKSHSKGLTWHVRDHEGAHSHVFCPVKYWMMLQNTFTADSIFLPVGLSASAVMTQMEQAVPEHILSAFPFKFSSRKSKVSWAYILPKFKKDWKAGRPIVSFSAHPARQFLVVMARVTEMLVAEVCPHTRPYNDAIMLWQAIHQLFGQTDSYTLPAPDPLALHNQDLSGFFVSIPVERFMITFRLLLTKFYGCADEDLENTLNNATITVDLTNDLSVMKTIRGRHCLIHDKHIAVPMRLFLEAVRVSFKFTLFTVGGQTIQQLRGAPMGSHFSPAACHAVVSLYEHMYFGHCLLQSARMPTFGLVVRYVDNRLALLHHSCDKQSVIRAFLHPDVYIPPIVLEYEDGNIFLGFDIDPVTRTVSYVQPDASWKFLHKKSAANTRTLLSSFRSRAHLITRASWPQEQRDRDLRLLQQAYVNQDYDEHLLSPILKHIRFQADFRCSPQSNQG